MADTEYLSTRQAALRLGVSLGTVQNMVENGVLEAWKTAGGHRRIPVASVETLLARRRNLTPSAQEAGGQLDILIAEDDEVLADGLCHSMRQSGYAVDCVKDGLAAHLPERAFKGRAPEKIL